MPWPCTSPSRKKPRWTNGVSKSSSLAPGRATKGGKPDQRSGADESVRPTNVKTLQKHVTSGVLQPKGGAGRRRPRVSLEPGARAHTKGGTRPSRADRRSAPLAAIDDNRKLIVTLTINPAIDRTISVDRLAFEDRARISSSRESAGGRGINASSVIHSFGSPTLALFPSGGEKGKRLEALLERSGFPISVIAIRNEIRTDLTITDRHGLTIHLNEAGPELSAAEVAQVEKAV